MPDLHRTMQNYWNSHARRDPLWAVVSDPSKAKRRWVLSEFMATGTREIALLWYELGRMNLRPSLQARALDFGCGVGRLTQALAARCGSVTGVDVSDEMLTIARAVGRHHNVGYHCNAREDLDTFPTNSFDLVYSNIVLQHIEPILVEGYLREFGRIIDISGLLIFQLPSHRAPFSPQNSKAMELEAYLCEILADVPRVLAPGQAVTLIVNVKNTSSRPWNQSDSGGIRLGNHWADSAGRMLIQDDGRGFLPDIMTPTESCQVLLTVNVPSEPGEYQLELDAVHEGITWFGDRGAPVFRARVFVPGDPPKDNVDSPSEIPYDEGWFQTFLSSRSVGEAESMAADSFPMYGIERPRVVELLEGAGFGVIDIREDDHARPEWISYRYIAQRK